MLEELDKVDWSRINHVFGPANDIPNLLRALALDDKQARQRAHDLLGDSLWHQGSICEASVYATPFLIELLIYDAVPDKANIVWLLCLLAESAPVYTVKYRKLFQPFKAERSNVILTDLVEEGDYVVATLHEVRKGVPVYFTLLRHEDREVREASVYLLGLFPSKAGRTTDVLKDCLANESDISVKAGILCELSKIDPAATISLLQSQLASKMDEMLVFTAAVLLAQNLGEQTPQEVINTIVIAADELGAIEDNQSRYRRHKQLYPCILWRDDAESALLRAICALGVARGTPLLIRALKAAVSPALAHERAKELLIHVFDFNQPDYNGYTAGQGDDGRDRRWYESETTVVIPTLGSLEPTQTDAVSAIASHDPFWEIETNLLQIFGLPSSRDKLRSLARSSIL